jgi:hypothetical protein
VKLAKRYNTDGRSSAVVIQDPQSRCTISLRLLAAHQVTYVTVDDTCKSKKAGTGQHPMFFGSYRIHWATYKQKSDQTEESKPSAAAKVCDASFDPIRVNMGTAMLLKDLLKQNQSTLSKKPRRGNASGRTGREPSFLLPCYNLTSEYLAQHQMPKICPTCGKEGHLRCGGCGAAHYCSKGRQSEIVDFSMLTKLASLLGCQLKHWESHKPQCTKAVQQPYLEAQHVPWQPYIKAARPIKSTPESSDPATTAFGPVGSEVRIVFQDGKRFIAKLTALGDRKLRIFGKGIDGCEFRMANSSFCRY